MSSRQHIVQEAKKLFRHKGYVAVSMADVVQACGVTKPTIYHYFGDKEGLYTETLLDILANGAQYAEPTLSKNINFKDKLTQLAIGYFEHSPTAVVTLLRDSTIHLNDENLARVNEAMQFYMYLPFEKLFGSAIQNRELPSSHCPKELALIFVTFLDTFTYLHRSKNANSKELKPVAETAIGYFFNGIQSQLSE